MWAVVICISPFKALYQLQNSSAFFNDLSHAIGDYIYYICIRGAGSGVCCKQDQASKQPLEIGGNVHTGESKFLPGRNNHLHRNSMKERLTVLQFLRADQWFRKVHKLNRSQQQSSYKKGIYFWLAYVTLRHLILDLY